MELLILGGLSLAGYTMSKKQREYVPVPFADPLVRNTNVSLNQQSVTDELTHSNMVPFYKSQKTQNANDNFKDRRLATFTGVNNVDFKKKQEVLQPPPESMITNPVGVTFQPDVGRYMDSVVQSKHNNVSPVEKQYVGPGLGTTQGSDQGFHDTFRIMPDNVNVYRKNNLTGSVVHGKSNIDNRSTLPGETTESKRQLSPECNNYINGAMSSVSAMTHRPDVLIHPNQQMYKCAPPTGPSSITSAHILNSQHNSPKNERTQSCVSGNPSNRSAHGNNHNFLMHDNERDTANCQFLNTQLPTASVNRRFDHTDNSTLRDNANCHRLNLSSSTNVAYNHNIENTPTQRGGCNQNTYNHPSFANGPMNDNSYVHTTTQRDNVNSYTAQPHSNGVKDYTNAYATTPSQSREFVISTARTPNGGRMNINHDKTQLNMDMKQDNNTNNISGGGIFSQGVQNFTSNNGTSITTKTSDPLNNRVFGYAQNNPLVTNVNR